MATISNRRALATTAAALGLGEFANAFDISFWEGAAVFSALFLLAALWTRRGGLGGPLLIGALCVFELQSYPTWQTNGLEDQIFQTAFAAVSAACLCIAVAVIGKTVTDRRRAAKLVQRAAA
jgi:hypothetical protein